MLRQVFGVRRARRVGRRPGFGLSASPETRLGELALKHQRFPLELATTHARRRSVEWGESLARRPRRDEPSRRRMRGRGHALVAQKTARSTGTSDAPWARSERGGRPVSHPGAERRVACMSAFERADAATAAGPVITSCRPVDGVAGRPARDEHERSQVLFLRRGARLPTHLPADPAGPRTSAKDALSRETNARAARSATPLPAVVFAQAVLWPNRYSTCERVAARPFA